MMRGASSSRCSAARLRLAARGAAQQQLPMLRVAL